MVAFMPNQVLEQQDWVLIVKVHFTACLHPALYGFPPLLLAVLQHLGNAASLTLGHPFFLGQLSGEFGSVLKDENESHIVDVCEHLRDRWASHHCPCLQTSRWEGEEGVEQDRIVPIPGVAQRIKQTLVRRVRHNLYVHCHLFTATKIEANCTGA